MRIRTVKPAFWTNEKLAGVPDFTRLLAIALLNYADDAGYFWANPTLIRGALFPFDEDSTRIRRGLAQLAAVGYLMVGKCPDGREAGVVVSFLKHQKIDKPTPSEIQPLVTFAEDSPSLPLGFDEDSLLDRKGKDRKGKDILRGPAAPRARNEMFDSLSVATDGDPLQLTDAKARAVGVALAAIRKVCPELTGDEISRRAANYRLHMPDVMLTAMSLANNWAKCDNPPPKNANDKRPNSRRFETVDDYSGIESHGLGAKP